METRYTGALTRKVVISMTRADLETRARDLASKAANLGLMALATKIQQELDALTV